MCYDPPLVRDKPLGAPAFVKLIYLGIEILNIQVNIPLALIPDDLVVEYVSIGSANGLVPSSSKLLLEPMLTQIYVAMWCK